jgi:enoyl-CoA hydratase
VLRAEGKHFCAGADLDEPGSERRIELRKQPDESWAFQRDIPKPTIAAVQGACVAGGQRFVWPCDLILASDDAFFRDPLLPFGVPGIPAHGHTWEYGPRLAREMLYTTRRVPALEAYRRGMVNRVVPRERLDEEAATLADEIAQMDPFGLALVKRSVNQTMDIIGKHYLVDRFQELMDGFDMDAIHAGHADATAPRASRSADGGS